MAKSVLQFNPTTGSVSGVVGTVNGQVLTWNGTSSQWEAQTSAGGSTSYDLAGEATGALSVSDIVFHFKAVRDFTITELDQGSDSTTVVVLKVNGTSASYPQSVTDGQTVTAVVSTAGAGVWFTAKGNV